MIAGYLGYIDDADKHPAPIGGVYFTSKSPRKVGPLVCPSAPVEAVTPTTSSDGQVFFYNINAHLSSVKMGQVYRPALASAVMEVGLAQNKNDVYYTYRCKGLSSKSSSVIDPRHNGRLHILFLDGHTQLVTFAKVPDQDETSGTYNTVFYQPALRKVPVGW